MDLWNVLVLFSKESDFVVDEMTISGEAGGEPENRAFINIYFCNHPHRSTSASAVSTRNDLNHESFLRWDRRGATKECLMDTLHFLRPKLERFSEKQLNQDYL